MTGCEKVQSQSKQFTAEDLWVRAGPVNLCAALDFDCWGVSQPEKGLETTEGNNTTRAFSLLERVGNDLPLRALRKELYINIENLGMLNIYYIVRLTVG